MKFQGVGRFLMSWVPLCIKPSGKFGENFLQRGSKNLDMMKLADVPLGYGHLRFLRGGYQLPIGHKN